MYLTFDLACCLQWTVLVQTWCSSLEQERHTCWKSCLGKLLSLPCNLEVSLPQPHSPALAGGVEYSPSLLQEEWTMVPASCRRSGLWSQALAGGVDYSPRLLQEEWTTVPGWSGLWSQALAGGVDYGPRLLQEEWTMVPDSCRRSGLLYSFCKRLQCSTHAGQRWSAQLPCSTLDHLFNRTHHIRNPSLKHCLCQPGQNTGLGMRPSHIQP